MSTDIPTPTRRIDLGRRCPLGSVDPSEATIEAWHNFTGSHAAYRLSMGECAGPPHSRIEIKHSCGWALSLRPGLKSWAEVADAIREHFGRLDAPAESDAQPSSVRVEGSGHPQPVRHGSDGHEGWMSGRCAYGQPGCVDRACICRCHIDCEAAPERPEGVGRLPWPHGPDPVTDAWLRDQGADPDAVRTKAREHIDTLIRRSPEGVTDAIH